LGEKYSAELLLNYCVRFYDRQFITRDHARGGIAGKFDALLNDHLQAGMPLSAGIPSVALFAQKTPPVCRLFWRPNLKRKPAKLPRS
jgi:hypothetical protein